MKTKILLIIIFGLILVSCSSTGGTSGASSTVEITPVMASATQSVQLTSGLEVSFSKDIWPVLEKFAVRAHGVKGGVSLESYEEVIRYVVPGNPEQSKLYQELTGKGMPLMPPDNPLPPETVQLFYDWIIQGAKNN